MRLVGEAFTAFETGVVKFAAAKGWIVFFLGWRVHFYDIICGWEKVWWSEWEGVLEEWVLLSAKRFEAEDSLGFH